MYKFAIAAILICIGCINAVATELKMPFHVPSEEALHEGTWLFWPHHYQFGIDYRNDLDTTWIELTEALIDSENVHIVVFNKGEKERVQSLLKSANVLSTAIDFKVHKFDDVWARDYGPIYAYDAHGELIIEDWGFNGWGDKYDFSNSDEIPKKIADEQKKAVIDLNSKMIVEGGAVEIDGNGTMLLTRSAILNDNRNPGMTERKAQELFKKYYGVSNFIWLDGVAGQDITDMHIDGFAKFANEKSLVTMSKSDLLTWGVPSYDVELLLSAKNNNDEAYSIVTLPLTENNVVTTYGKNLGYQGSYVNYYVANKRVLVPNYSDPNDKVANKIIEDLYPNRTVVGIDVRNLYANGGMIHCVTQQQPVEKALVR